MDAWDHLAPADDRLFYSRRDPNDPRLGDVVRRDRDACAWAETVLVGCPQDEGIRRNLGRPGAARAVRA